MFYSTFPPLAFSNLQQTPSPPPPPQRNIFKWGGVRWGVFRWGGGGFRWGGGVISVGGGGGAGFRWGVVSGGWGFSGGRGFNWGWGDGFKVGVCGFRWGWFQVGGGCSGGRWGRGVFRWEGGMLVQLRVGLGGNGGYLGSVGGGFSWGVDSGGGGWVQVGGCSGVGAVQVRGDSVGGGFRWGGGGLFRCGGVHVRGFLWGEGSKGANVRAYWRGAKGNRWGGELIRIFLQIEFRFWNGLGQAVHSLCKVPA